MLASTAPGLDVRPHIKTLGKPVIDARRTSSRNLNSRPPDRVEVELTENRRSQSDH